MKLNELVASETGALVPAQPTFTQGDWQRFLAYLGENPNRQGLQENPHALRRRGDIKRPAMRRIQPKS